MAEAEPIRSESTFPQYGSYRVEQPLGSGGMSSVYRAVHVETGHVVALKVLPAHLARNPIVLQRFIREARSAESLQHPNIISIYDRGVDSGRHYLVLEYVEGLDLHAYVQQRGPLSVAEAVQVVRKVAEGLRYAGQQGLVHRDIKPSNILRGKTAEIKITDLGLALQWEFEDERVTREGTTVGTVDYMSPEQARDSRAAGPLSDLYSLGCTLYYLLTGIPPFPGGDITDKLTRHAQSSPPDVRDLRPDVPEELSRLMLRMMAKRPEDRVAGFDALIEELDRIPIDHDDLPAIALAPLGDHQQKSTGVRVDLDSSKERPLSSIPEISLANLPPDLLESGHEPVLELPSLTRSGASGSGVLSRSSSHGGPEVEAAARAPMSVASWIILCAALGVGFVLAIVAIDFVVRPAPPVSLPPEIPPIAAAPPIENTPNEPEPEANPATVPNRTAVVEPPLPATKPATADETKGPERLAEVWVEPEDAEPPPPAAEHYSEETLRKYLPAWALVPVPKNVDGPVAVVRRAPASGELSLRGALDERKGTVEIADEGPFLLHDARITGDSRVIRARDGYRSIIYLDRPTLEAVRSLPGVFVLNGKSLVLDSLDLIVNVRDLPPSQDCLFYCNGANLTLRDCTITIVNATNQPFALARTAAADNRGCRIRFENSFIRGLMSQALDLGPGPADVVLRDTLLLGSQGPVARFARGGPSAERRFCLLGSVTASLGPVIELIAPEGASAGKAHPVEVRAFRSVMGRFQGAGVASVIACGAPHSSPREQIDWTGDRNLFCGWKGHYATGREPTIEVSGLSAHSSTWNGSEAGSQSISFAWPHPQYVDQSEPHDWLPFAPGWEVVLQRVARARPYLGHKTIWSFPPVAVPLPAILANPDGRSSGTELLGHGSNKDRRIRDAMPRPSAAISNRATAGTAEGVSELLFDAAAPDWQGDLGAFLRDRVRGLGSRVRVLVRGSGPRTSSPVRFPDGSTVEIRVEPPGRGGQWLSWAPKPDSSAEALLELRGGSLVLSQVHLRDEPASSIPSLIRVEEGDLVLHRCRLTGSAGDSARSRRLVGYTAATTRPRPPPPPGLFVTNPDGPVCIIAESTLIGSGTALRAEVGHGLLALSQSVLATSGNAIELIPAPVARARFAADLVVERCTLTSETNIVHLGAWTGRAPGPDRPWLIRSERIACLDTYDRRVSDTVLLRGDTDAISRGLVFWQGLGDALEVDRFVVCDDEPPSGRASDVVLQWVHLWGSNHQREITGPRAGSNLPSVRLLDRLRVGQVEPADLWLDPTFHPGRSSLNVGADLSLQGIAPRSNAGARRR